MKRSLYYGLLLSVIPLLSHCGKSSGGDTSVGVKVGSISTAVVRRGVSQGRSVPSDAPLSTTEYAYAKVDGIKLTLTRLQAIKGSTESDIISWDGGKEVIIAPGTSNNLPINENASINSGSYNALKVRYKNSYGIKAFCRTATQLVYTSAAGIVKVPLGPTALPSDYDYYAYPFAEISTAKSAAGGNNDTMAQTDGSYTVTKGSALTLAVLFDPSYLVSCYDGSTTVGGTNTNALSPFVWSNNNGQALTSFFPDGSPNFGMGYVPIFVWLSTTAGEALPTAETYASSTTSANVTGNGSGTINFKNVSITSFAFRADGSVLDARSRIAAGGGSSDLYQFFTDYTKTRTSYSFKNGEWNCDAAYTNCHGLQDRSLSGFTRTAVGDFTSTSTSAYESGPDCGKSITDPSHPEWGNRVRACLSSAQTMTWRQLPR